jgi:hypothetical protein
MKLFSYNEPENKKSIKPVTKLGSNWNNGSNAGSFNWNVNNTSSNRNISGHLLNAQGK